MIRTWQDYDENCRSTWGMWFGSLSSNGHVYLIVGPFHTREECISKLGGENAQPCRKRGAN